MLSPHKKDMPVSINTPQRLVILAVAACWLPLSAAAATVAAQAGVFTVTCPTLCGGPGAVASFDGDGGEGFTSAFAALSGGPAGNGRSRAQITGTGLVLPELGAEAYPTIDGQVVADAGAMQKYVYNGPDNSQFVLQLAIDGSVNAAQADTALLAGNAAVVLAPAVDFSVDPGTFIFENVALDPNASLLVEGGIDFAARGLFNLGLQNATEALAFTLNDGDEVLIWASLRVRGTRGSNADAYTSLALTFTSGNVAGLTPVPIAPPLVLMPAALGLLAAWRRRSPG